MIKEDVQALKDLLVLPLDHIGDGFVADGSGKNIFGIYPRRSLFTKGRARSVLIDVFIDFIVQAFNEKWQRDFVEPKRWVIVEHLEKDCTLVKCPHCNFDFFYTTMPAPVNYCRSCGERLLPPEEDK